MLTKNQAYRPPTLNVGGHDIEIQRLLRYWTFIWIPGYPFDYHMGEVITSAAKTAVTLVSESKTWRTLSGLEDPAFVCG